MVVTLDAENCSRLKSMAKLSPIKRIFWVKMYKKGEFCRSASF